MDGFIELIRAVRAEWSTLIAHPEAFGAIAAMGLLFGWTAAWLILKQRLIHHRELIEHYKDVLAEKAPAIVASNRQLAPPRFTLKVFLFGLLLIGAGFFVTLFAKISEPKSPGVARIQYTDLKFVESAKLVAINLFLQNTGNLAAIGLAHTDGVIILDREATDAELDQIFDAIKKKRAEFTKEADSEIQPGQGVWYTLPFGVAPNDFEQIKNGPKFLYIFVYLTQRDSALPKGKYNIAEICMFTFKGQGIHLCNHHNRFYHN